MKFFLRQPRTPKVNKLVFRTGLFLLVAGVLTLNSTAFLPIKQFRGTVSAATIEELQEQSEELQEKIDENTKKAQNLRKQGDTLEAKVDLLEAEISQANAEISKSEVNIDRLDLRLKEAEKELEKQKKLLKVTLQALYERRGASEFELLMATDSFSDFITEQEYLSQLQSAVKQSTDKVVELKLQIESEKA